MPQKWEMCSIGGTTLTFFRPGEPMERISIRDFIRTQASPVRGDDLHAAIACLLREGWEQYLASPDGHIFFRRLASS